MICHVIKKQLNFNFTDIYNMYTQKSLVTMLCLSESPNGFLQIGEREKEGRMD